MTSTEIPLASAKPTFCPASSHTDRRYYRDRDNRRYKYTGYLICDLCDRRFCSSRIADHLDDLGQVWYPLLLCVASQRINPDWLIVAADTSVPLFFIHRDTLSGQCRFIDCAVSFQDLYRPPEYSPRVAPQKYLLFVPARRYGDFCFLPVTQNSASSAPVSSGLSAHPWSFPWISPPASFLR